MLAHSVVGLVCLLCTLLVATSEAQACPEPWALRNTSYVEAFRDFWPAKITKADETVDDGETGWKVEGFASVLRRANEWAVGKCITSQDTFLANAKALWKRTAEDASNNAPAAFNELVGATGGQSHISYHVKAQLQVIRMWYLADPGELDGPDFPATETIIGSASSAVPSVFLAAFALAAALAF